LAWRCGGFLSKVQYLLSINHTSKNYEKHTFYSKKHKFTQKSTSYLPFKPPLEYKCAKRAQLLVLAMLLFLSDLLTNHMHPQCLLIIFYSVVEKALAWELLHGTIVSFMCSKI